MKKMEIKAQLKKPYTEKERIDFIVQYNHNLGYEIEETKAELQALGYTQEELDLLEQERIAKLYLTSSDVERGIYQVIGMDFDDILVHISELKPEGVDLKALKIELKANHFYRGNPYVDVVGKLLGFSKIQLDNFFETNDPQCLKE